MCFHCMELQPRPSIHSLRRLLTCALVGKEQIRTREVENSHPRLWSLHILQANDPDLK